MRARGKVVRRVAGRMVGRSEMWWMGTTMVKVHMCTHTGMLVGVAYRLDVRCATHEPNPASTHSSIHRRAQSQRRIRTALLKMSVRPPRACERRSAYMGDRESRDTPRDTRPSVPTTPQSTCILYVDGTCADHLVRDFDFSLRGWEMLQYVRCYPEWRCMRGVNVKVKVTPGMQCTCTYISVHTWSV